MKKKIGLSSMAVAALLSLAGCGGGSNPPSAQTGTGYYVDNAVEGIDYVCGSQTGKTGTDGKFTFEEGKECKFTLAGVPLRTTKADELADGKKILEDNPKVAKFLQSIDADGDLGNGIQITDEVLAALTDALETAQSAGQLPEGDTLTEVVASVGHAVTGVSGEVRTDEEVQEHLDQTRTEITKELLAGKTFYVIGQSLTDSSDVWYGEAAFNESLTSMTWTDFVDTQDSGEESIQIEGDKLLFLSDTDGRYTIIGSDRGDYIEGTDYFANGSVESHTRLYYDKAKADVYVDSLNVSDNVSDLETLIVGKTLYQHCADENGDWIATLTAQEDGNLLFADNNGASETIPYRIDGNIIYTTEDGVEKAHTLIENTDTYIKFDDGGGETTTFYFTAEAAQAAPANDCGGDSYETPANGIATGNVTFKDVSGNPIATPSDAWIRITPQENQIDGSWNGLRCKIASDGSFGTSECYINGSYDEMQSLFNTSSSFQVVVFKNHIEPDEHHWGCGEDVYKYVGNGDSTLWQNIEVLPEDYQDRSGEICN